MNRRNAGHVASTTLAVVAALLMNSFVPAQAGPDQDRTELSGTHVDGPTGQWNSNVNNFDLKAKVAEKFYDLDGVTMYVPQTDDGRRQRHIEKFDPSVAATTFASSKATAWWNAPKTPTFDRLPIFAGYGAFVGGEDKVVPESISLDIMKVTGPGDVEIANYLGNTATRYFSSSDPSIRSLFNPTHMHVNTLFSKPGRYELTYRSVARLKDGGVIHSEPKNVVWQVGGPNPKDGSVKDAVAAYHKASSELLDASVSLKSSGSEGAAPSTVSFTGPQGLDGTLTGYIDGRYLYELPVKDGKAEFSQFMGQASSQLQFVFVSTDGKKRWASIPTEVEFGHGATLTGSSNEEVNPQPRDHNPEFEQPQRGLDGKFNVSFDKVDPSTVEEWETNYFDLKVQADPALKAYYKVEFFRDSKSKYPDCAVEGSLIHGASSEPKDLSGCDGFDMKVSLFPHPDHDLPIFTKTIPHVKTSVAGKLDFNLTDSQDEPRPSTPAQPQNPTPPSDNKAITLEDPVTLHHGHMDIRLEPHGEGLQMALGDDSREHAAQSVKRKLEGNTLVVPSSAQRVRTRKESGSEYDFLGKVGDSFSLLPETQDKSLVWPGFSTESIADYSKFPDGLDVKMQVKSAPEGGRVAFYQESLAGPEVLLDSSDPSKKIHTTVKTHLHGNWVFTKPGRYEIAFGGESGTRQVAPPQTLIFDVAEKARAEQPKQEANNSSVGSSSPVFWGLFGILAAVAALAPLALSRIDVGALLRQFRL